LKYRLEIDVQSHSRSIQAQLSTLDRLLLRGNVLDG
jgi:hypothetical protein